MGLKLTAVFSALLILSGGTTQVSAQSVGGTASENMRIEDALYLEPITGAAMAEGHLFITGANTITIFDVSHGGLPRLVSKTPSVNTIHGELLPTDGETLILNDWGSALDIWDVEDKSNPVHVASFDDIEDEHFACLLDCQWVYGSEGTILDLRMPIDPKLRTENWIEILHAREPKLSFEDVHRVDEFKPGWILTAPRMRVPAVIDVRDPLNPKVRAKAILPIPGRDQIIGSTWPRGRFMFSAVEISSGDGCNEFSDSGSLIAFDTSGWPKTKRFHIADAFTPEAANCRPNGYYPSFRGDFDGEGLLVLPHNGAGVSIVEVAQNGRMTEIGWFRPALSMVWHAFWGPGDTIYSVNNTGELVTLSYCGDACGP